MNLNTVTVQENDVAGQILGKFNYHNYTTWSYKTYLYSLIIIK